MELINLDGVLSWRYTGESDSAWREIASLPTAAPPISLTKLGTYTSSEGAEIVAFDPSTARAFVTAGATVEVLDVSDPSQPVLEHVIDASSDGDGVTSVDVKDGLLGIAVDADRDADPSARGKALFYSATSFMRIAEAGTGVLPDMITFTPDGKYALVANEGEPSDDYTTDPVGSVTVIDIDGGFTTATAAFDASVFDLEALQADGLRVFGPGAGLAEDVEPEYITVTPDSSTAYVALQENNALAVVDVASATVTEILPLGYKDHSLPGNELDASNEDGAINIRNWPVLGMYQPDAITSYVAPDGKVYIVTANEGDARDYDGYSEEARVKDLTLDPAAFPDADALQADDMLGRLKTTTAHGDTDGDGDHDVIYSYGARSLTIRDTDGNVVFDSGSSIAQLLTEHAPEAFNSNGLADGFDGRSDDKGSEPEAVAVARLWGRTYAFLGLERIGGVAVFDVTYPREARLLDYVSNTNRYGDPDAGTAGDLAPEGLEVVSADDSPTGAPLLLVSNEVSQTVTIYGIARQARGGQPSPRRAPYSVAGGAQKARRPSATGCGASPPTVSTVQTSGAAPRSITPANTSFVESADQTRWDGANWSKNCRCVRKSGVGMKRANRRVSPLAGLTTRHSMEPSMAT